MGYAAVDKSVDKHEAPHVIMVKAKEASDVEAKVDLNVS